MIVGVIETGEARGSIAGAWSQISGAPELLVAPPAQPGDLASADILISTTHTSLAALRSTVGTGPTLFRAVVTSGAFPGEGMAVVASEPGTSEEAVSRAREALAWIGPVEVVGEEALDAFIALAAGAAGLLCEALQGLEDGAVADGLPQDIARRFVHRTTLATALLLSKDSGSPADLKDRVASPGGTTIAALAALEDAGVRGAFIRAVQRTAAEVRAQRVGERFGEDE